MVWGREITYKGIIMKYWVWLALIAAVVVIFNEIAYVGDTSLAWVIIGLALAVGFLAIHLLAEKK